MKRADMETAVGDKGRRGARVTKGEVKGGIGQLVETRQCSFISI